MKVYRSLDEIGKINQAIVTQGTFDGVHVAHQVILKRLNDLKSGTGRETVLITYEPHPRMVLFPETHGLSLLTDLDEKIELLSSQGVDHLLVIPFTPEFSNLSSLDFIRSIIVEKLNTSHLVIGYNHRFGKNREGSFSHLREFSKTYGFEVDEIPEQDVDQVSVSSTKIRESLQKGSIKTATSYLGREYCITAKVVLGKQLGRTIGFPTANLEPRNPFKLVPQDGVYAVKVNWKGKSFGGMMNIGKNPTFPEKGRSMEVHIFDFTEDIYNQSIRVSFVDKLREEKKFSGIEELQSQLNRDKLRALEVLTP
ncbi:MAG: bifunctional riboflavin kinase/FAD synthetase [Bacteroidetes bacterium]|nr:bifunctional riboflavin kinase/FAD synthetase [Bacteroidota bacterium]